MRVKQGNICKENNTVPGMNSAKKLVQFFYITLCNVSSLSSNLIYILMDLYCLLGLVKGTFSYFTH